MANSTLHYINFRRRKEDDKKMVSATNLEELCAKVKTKLKLQESVRIYIEETGTLVDDEEVFDYAKDKTLLVLCGDEKLASGNAAPAPVLKGEHLSEASSDVEMEIPSRADEVTITNEHHKTITANLTKLVGNMKATPVMRLMMEKNALHQYQYNTVDSMNNPDDQNFELLSMIKKGSEKMYHVFINALHNTNQGCLANSIEGSRTDGSVTIEGHIELTIDIITYIENCFSAYLNELRRKYSGTKSTEFYRILHEFKCRILNAQQIDRHSVHIPIQFESLESFELFLQSYQPDVLESSLQTLLTTETFAQTINLGSILKWTGSISKTEINMCRQELEEASHSQLQIQNTDSDGMLREEKAKPNGSAESQTSGQGELHRERFRSKSVHIQSGVSVDGKQISLQRTVSEPIVNKNSCATLQRDLAEVPYHYIKGLEAKCTRLELCIQKLESENARMKTQLTQIKADYALVVNYDITMEDIDFVEEMEVVSKELWITQDLRNIIEEVKRLGDEVQGIDEEYRKLIFKPEYFKDLGDAEWEFAAAKLALGQAERSLGQAASVLGSDGWRLAWKLQVAEGHIKKTKDIYEDTEEEFLNKQSIIEHWSELISQMNAKPIITLLSEKKDIIKHQLDTLMTTAEQNDIVLRIIIPRGSFSTFDFIAGLRNSGQGHLADIIEASTKEKILAQTMFTTDLLAVEENLEKHTLNEPWETPAHQPYYPQHLVTSPV